MLVFWLIKTVWSSGLLDHFYLKIHGNSVRLIFENKLWFDTIYEILPQYSLVALDYIVILLMGIEIEWLHPLQ